MKRDSRVRLLAIVVLASVFGAGLLVGMAFEPAAFATNAPPPSPQEPGETAPAEREGDEGGGEDEADRERRPPRYTQVGGLTAVQDAAIDSIVDLHRSSYRTIHRDVRRLWEEREDSLVAATRLAIMEVMTPEQAERYRVLLAEEDRRREERERERQERRDGGQQDDREDPQDGR